MGRRSSNGGLKLQHVVLWYAAGLVMLTGTVQNWHYSLGERSCNHDRLSVQQQPEKPTEVLGSISKDLSNVCLSLA